MIKTIPAMNKSIRNPKQDIKWVSTPFPETEMTDSLLSSVQNLHPIVASLLVQRGVDTFEKVRDFFNPTMDLMENFNPMLGLEKATERVLLALDKNEKILLYGDYDVDGTCSVAMLYLFLKSLHADVSYYIPDRYSEGYGLSESGVRHAAEIRANLVITIDCGITAVERVREGNEIGLEFIICDHHLPGRELPGAFAILNPMQSGCDFDGKELCGCGVGLMLVKSICEKRNLPEKTWQYYLSYAAVATCCDIVPLTGINRAIVHEGMRWLGENPPVGLFALLKIAGHEGPSLSVSDIVFKIGPRINAAGRLTHAHTALELLIESDPGKAAVLAAGIEKLNLERRTMDKSITAEAVEKMREMDPEESLNVTVVHHAGWHKGLIGIVASRLTEVCYRPTVVLTESNGMLTGSARSVDGFNLFEAIESCSASLVQFGGHKAAAGLTMRPENLEEFISLFDRAAANGLGAEGKIPRLNIDLELELIDWYNQKVSVFTKQLSRMQPFGPCNSEPVFYSKRCIAKYPQILKNEHLKFSVFPPSHPTSLIPVIAFQQARHYEQMMDGHPFTLAYTITERTWKERTSIQLEAKGIRFEDHP